MNLDRGKMERWASMLGGAALVALALKRRSKGSFGLALAGAPLLFRGATGRWPLYRAMGRALHRSEGTGFQGTSASGGWRSGSTAEGRLESQGTLGSAGRASASPTSWGTEGVSSSTYGSLGNETRSEDRSAGSPVGSRGGSERDPIGQRID